MTSSTPPASAPCGSEGSEEAAEPKANAGWIARVLASNRRSPAPAAAALLLAVFGLRLWLFDFAGSPLPFWDQWFGEIRDQAGGRLFDWGLLGPHNEHLIATTRFVSRLGRLLNGYWDATFLSIWSCLVGATNAALAWLLVGGGLRTGRERSLLAFTAAFFFLPAGAISTLSGLQVSVTLGTTSLLAGLLVVQRWSTPWRSGLLLFACSAAGLLSITSAVLNPLAYVTFHYLVRRERPGLWWTLLALAAPSAQLVLTRPETGIDRALTVSERVGFFLEVCSWPAGSAVLGVGALALALAFFAHGIRRRATNRPQEGALLALGAFTLVLIALLATRRSALHPRHLEAISLFFFSLVGLGITALCRIRAAWGKVLAFVALVALGAHFLRAPWPYFQASHATREGVLRVYQREFRAGHFDSINASVRRDLDREDYRFFDDMALRFAPPFRILREGEVRPRRSRMPREHRAAVLPALGPTILEDRSLSTLSRLCRLLLAAGPLLLGLGAGALGWLMIARPGPEPAPSEAADEGALA